MLCVLGLLCICGFCYSADYVWQPKTALSVGMFVFVVLEFWIAGAALLVFSSCKIWRLHPFMDWFWKEIRS